MFWFIIIAVVGVIGFKFFSSLQEDKNDLQNRTLSDKFQTIVSMVNEAAFNGQGKVTEQDKREFNLYKEGENQIIKFQYSTGILTLIWKYKYFQKEVVLERQFDNARNLSIFEQQKFGQDLINEMLQVIAKHKAEVMIPVLSTPIKRENNVTIFRTSLENSLREMIHKRLENSHNIPEMMHGLMVMQTAGTFRETFTENYLKLKNEVEEDGTIAFMPRMEYDKLIDDITSKILREFIDMPESQESDDENYYDDPY